MFLNTQKSIFDTTHQLKCEDVHKGNYPFTKNERSNLGVIKNPVWLRLDLKKLNQFGEYRYLVVGNQRTFALSHFVADSSGQIEEIPESLVKFQHVLDAKDLEGQDYLYVVGNDLYVPTYMHVYLLKTENDLMNFHSLIYYLL
jgi:hypothetical protein